MTRFRPLIAPIIFLAALAALGFAQALLSARLGLVAIFPQWNGMLQFGAYLGVAWLLSRLADMVLTGLRPRSRPVPKLLKDLIAGLLFLIAIISGAMLMLGHGAGGALASSGVVLALMGFAIRNVVADTLSGIALGLEGPFRIGDWVHVEGMARGRVVEIGWRTTRLLTRDSTYVILPNSQISRQRIVNYSAPSSVFRAQVEIVLDHSVPAAEGADILRTALRNAPRIKQVPPPDVRVMQIGTDGVHYALRYWLDRFDHEIDCRDAIWRQVDIALRQAQATTPLRRVTVLDTQPRDDASLLAQEHDAAATAADGALFSPKLVDVDSPEAGRPLAPFPQASS